jgi:hypothetical protein
MTMEKVKKNENILIEQKIDIGNIFITIETIRVLENL